jgi:quinol-cytochrome oxidoreductase complex cytochrome b subunit
LSGTQKKVAEEKVAEKERSARPGWLRRLLDSVFTEQIYPETSRQRSRNAFDALILHLHPPTVPARTLRFSLTWGLGGMALVLVTLMVLTGILLLFAYEPLPGAAYESIERLQSEVPFGSLVRAIHHWSANLLVVAAFLHLLRVFFTGAFTGPRRFNWVIGLGLFLFVLASNLTGYLLPWDQRAFWAVTICTSMLGYIPLAGPWLQELLRGGAEVGPAALRNFTVLHTTFLPLGLIALLPFHFWRIRKAGGLVVPRAPDEVLEKKGGYVTTIPHLVMREGVTALVLIAAVFLFSALVNAPLGAPANPGMSPNPAKAPWYFLGLQELLMHFDPLFAVFVIPLVLTAALLLLPYLGLSEEAAGVWFISAKGRLIARHATTAAFIVTPLLIGIDSVVTGLGGRALPPWVSGGLLPFVLLTGALCAWYLAMRVKGGASKNEAVQGVFVFLVVGLAVLTATGLWFRGEGMALRLPW